MEKIGNYYQSSIYEKTAQAAKDADRAKAGSARKAGGTEEGKKAPALSKAAQNLLKELKKTYSNMDFIVADFETDEEAASLMSRGTAEYSALFTPEELEKMAADEDVKNKNMKILDGAVSKLDEMKTKLGDKADDVTRIGISFGDDGEVSFFAELEKNSEKQRERIEKQREDKKDAAKENGKAEAAEYLAHGKPTSKRTTVYASTIEELAEKIANVDWNAVKEERQSTTGQRFDFTV
ncbi:DUF6033 family protein [uncultured Acetatifactor sp.]|uniref:DUF6033 family protein n=1 Tax=uncultured Acetatifactor sp. TaxID=1671927 RepID=UPI00260BC2FF|nr:DUF6033 family protein [uncultured Acetatifactor sp.]